MSLSASQHAVFIQPKTIKVMAQVKRKINLTNRTEGLLMYCKLLKYMRSNSSVVPHSFYKTVCKNEFRPFIKTSPYLWDRQPYYAFWYSEAYGWMVVSLNRLNDVRL